MEIIGDDKRIRALFSEAKVADEQTAPPFTATWGRTPARALKPRRALNFSFAVAAALLVCGFASLALWSKYQTGRTVHTAVANVHAGSIVNPPQAKYGPQALVPDVQANNPRIKVRRTPATQSNTLTLAATRKADQKAEHEAKQLSSWQSPTASLLSSSSDSLFKSLPQLNENSTELKSFLPNRENEKEK